MSLGIYPRELLSGRVTYFTLTSNKGNWIPGSPGKPSFTVVGASGDSITDQVILDPSTATIGLKSTQVNDLVTITDTLNNEAVSVACRTTDVMKTLGRTGQDDGEGRGDSRHGRGGK
jgi:hypothetical protein